MSDAGPRPPASAEWVDVLRALDAPYGDGSSGGSEPIRRHRRRVHALVEEALAAGVEVVDRDPVQLPVVAHLPRALELGGRGPLAPLARALDRVKHHLTWEYGYDDLPGGLAETYAYCEILGPHGPVVRQDLILGLVLFAPGTTYPEHHHVGIEESYVSVAGAWSQNDAAVHAPGSLVLNVERHEHRITTGEHEPALLAYAWLGDPERLANPGMTFSDPPRP